MNSQRGFVSLFTAIMLSLLLLVITVSMISLEVLQLRKSEDSEQTMRAYYAAEAGIEDATAKVLNGTWTAAMGNRNCLTPGAKNPTYDTPGAAGWTCQQVTFSGNPTGNIEADAAKTVDPGTGVAYNRVVIEWNQAVGVTPSVPFGDLRDYATYTGNNYPPVMEVAIVQYPNGTFSSSDPLLQLTNAVIVPRGGGAGGVAYGATGTGTQFSGNCTANPGPRTILPPLNIASVYNCYAEITGLIPARNYLFRLRPRYGATSYRMTFALGNSVKSVPDGTATIDVTAMAGQTSRRVISKVPMNGSAASGLNYVMYSDNDICKNFDVISGLPQTGGNCPY